MARLRVRRADGSRAGLGHNLARAALWVVDGFPYLIPGLVGFVTILARDDRRRLADLATGTVVAGRHWQGEPTAPASAMPAPPPAPSGWIPPGPETPR